MKPFYPTVKRISRLYFWIAWPLCNIFCGLLEWAFLMEYGSEQTTVNWVALIAAIVFHVLYVTLLIIKRFHDAGKSTPYALLCIALTPFGIGLGMIVSVAIKESDKDNAWGLNEERMQFERESEYYRR